MKAPFATFTGTMAVIPLANINTDAIIPSSYLRSVNADLGKGLFGGHRYDEAGREQPDFVLNRLPFRTAQILLADENFGCGSSREAAVWALQQFGIRCVLAPSFADIFYENAFRNGLLAGLIEPATFATLAETVEAHLDRPDFTVDLQARMITGPDGRKHQFYVSAIRSNMLMRGDDEIDITLRHSNEIEAYYAAAKTSQGWLYQSVVATGEEYS